MPAPTRDSPRAAGKGELPFSLAGKTARHGGRFRPPVTPSPEVEPMRKTLRSSMTGLAFLIALAVADGSRGQIVDDQAIVVDGVRASCGPYFDAISDSGCTRIHCQLIRAYIRDDNSFTCEYGGCFLSFSCPKRV
jgi:hypothetical protein